MRSSIVACLCALLTGCANEAQIVADMEQALFDSQAAVAVQLLATEMIAHTFDEPSDTPTTTLRHGESCGCPCIERIGDEPPYILTLDYPDGGCVPLTGLVPGSLSGHAVLEYDGSMASVTFDGLEVGLGNVLTGTVQGGPPGEAMFPVRADMTAGDYAVTLNTETGLSEATGLFVDGTATVDEAEVQLSAIDLPWDEIPPPCPSPASGQATRLGGPDVTVDFADPGNGRVTVARRSRVSDAVDYCGYRTSLF
ncbi:MAG: hypothetical protein KTR31_12935 [Myxococcales bacterium]|nr:hypothetical protein [Myxococcales bacterium]